MARRSIAQAVTCASCGAKGREDRVRCLRCGEPLVAAAGDTGRRSVNVSTLLVGAAALTALALVGLAARPSPVPPKQEQPPLAVKATPAPAVSAVESRAAREDVRPGPVISRDAITLGQVAYAAADVPAAVAHFQRAAELNPADSEALNNLGQALVRAGRPAEAVPYFDRAVAIGPTNWAYRFNRARALGEMGQWSDAAEGYRDAQRLFPDDYATEFNLAKALQRSGDLTAALGAFERAIALAPGQPDFHLSHGLALEAAQRPKEAAAAYRRFLELADASPETDKVKGRLAQLEGPAAPR